MRLLLLRLSSFGDVVLTLPAAKAIAESLPGCALHWAIEPPLAELVAGAPYVAGVLQAATRAWRRAPFSGATWRDARAFLRAARAARFDLVVDAQGLFKSAWAAALVPATRKVGFGYRSATERVACLAVDEHVETRAPHVADRALALAEYLTGRSGFERIPDVAHLVERPDPAVDAFCEKAPPFALLQPFASRPAKEWRSEQVVAFARSLREAAGLASVIRWGPGERERAEALVRAIGDGSLLAPPSGPAASARLAARAALFVGADTGPTHLAAAAGVPTVALFGPSDPARFRPLGPRVSVLRAPGDRYNASAGTDVPPAALLPQALALLDAADPRRAGGADGAPPPGGG